MEVKLFKIFISCTSEIIEELQFLFKAENIINSIRSDFNVKMIHFTTETFPSSGNHPQKIINQQISDSYDIYLGLFWTKYGSPTDEYDSGVIEEFENALKLNKKIMFYFNLLTPKYLNQINLSQVEKINKFKSELGNRDILYYEYKGVQDFENVIMGHIVQQIEELISHSNFEDSVIKTIDEINEEIDHEYYEIDFDELSDFPEFIESLENSLLELQRIIQNNLNDLIDFGQLLANKVGQLEDIERVTRKKRANSQFKQIAKEIKIFRLQLDTNINILKENSEQVVKEMNNAILFFPKGKLSKEQVKSLISLHSPIEDMVGFYDKTSKEIEEMKFNLVLLSKLSHYIRKENRITIKLMSELQTEIDIYSQNIFDFGENYLGDTYPNIE